MKFKPAPDDFSTMMFHRQVSENELVEIGVYRVAYGWRVRAGFVNDFWVAIDWCAGGVWEDVERLYSICLAILSETKESYQCFEELPSHSNIKPFYLDLNFVKVIEKKAGNFTLIKLAPDTKVYKIYKGLD